MSKPANTEPPITKLDAARRQLVTALKLFFDDRDPVSVYALAQASMEVFDALCRHNKRPTFLDLLSDDNNMRLGDLRKIATFGKNFLKHADRDPEATLDDFYDGRNDGILFTAIQDLKTLNSNKLPIEAQAFELWFFAINPEKLAAGNEQMAADLQIVYTEYETKDRETLKRETKRLLENAYKDKNVTDDINTDTTELARWSDN